MAWCDQYCQRAHFEEHVGGRRSDECVWPRGSNAPKTARRNGVIWLGCAKSWCYSCRSRTGLSGKCRHVLPFIWLILRQIRVPIAVVAVLRELWLEVQGRACQAKRMASTAGSGLCFPAIFEPPTAHLIHNLSGFFPSKPPGKNPAPRL